MTRREELPKVWVCTYCLYSLGTVTRDPSNKHLDEKHGVQSYAVRLDKAVLPGVE